MKSKNINWVEKFINYANQNGSTVRVNNHDGTIELYNKEFKKWFSWIFLKNAESEYNHYFA